MKRSLRNDKPRRTIRVIAGPVPASAVDVVQRVCWHAGRHHSDFADSTSRQIVQINLSLAVEKAFNIRFRVGEVEATKNVGDFANLIARRVDGA